MNSTANIIQIIPDLTIDDKYTSIISEAQARMQSFVGNAVNGERISELFILERTKVDDATAKKILKANGRLVVGFQFEAKPDALDENFRVFVKKIISNGRNFKFYLTPTVQEIMLQLISLEDRRTIAIFSMLNSSLDVGYRILTTLYGNQLKRLLERAPDFIRDSMGQKLEKLKVARDAEDSELWEEQARPDEANNAANGPRTTRSSEDNILQVMADDGTYEEINQYLENVVSRKERIREKRRKLEENPDLPREELYKRMVREDYSQLENCYARMHIYMKAFYKNQQRRNVEQNRILRQFFAGEIERITGETGLLEDLLSLNMEQYFINIDRHNEL